MTTIRGIRGATVADRNTKEDILTATQGLLENVLAENKVRIEDIASIFFSVTKDLDAEFPAVAARKLGLSNTPLLCLNEIDVPGSLSHCIRVLIHVNTQIPQSDIQHVYLKEAVSLRPDQVKNKV